MPENSLKNGQGLSRSVVNPNGKEIGLHLTVGMIISSLIVVLLQIIKMFSTDTKHHRLEKHFPQGCFESTSGQDLKSHVGM